LGSKENICMNNSNNSNNSNNNDSSKTGNKVGNSVLRFSPTSANFSHTAPHKSRTIDVGWTDVPINSFSFQ
jgi:hypothetical protein